MSDLLLELTRHIKDIERAIERLKATEVPGVPVAVRVYNDANQSIDTSVFTALAFNSERFDTHGQHFSSSAALTGTVTKAATSAVLVGAGTLFLTELSIGQVITVPGTATEKRVVIAIADDTHLTVAVAFANNAAGQTATRVNSALVCRQAGKYMIGGHDFWDDSSAGKRYLGIRLNDSLYIAMHTDSAAQGGGVYMSVATCYALAVWDYVELPVWQDIGGPLNVVASAATSPEFWMARVA